MPARKPRRLKLVAGTLKPCRDRDELQLPQLEGLPDAPQFLDIIAAQEFDRVARILVENRVLSEGDFGLLTAYAACWSGLARQWEHGLRPAAADITVFRQLSNELGLSPRARAGMPPVGKTSPANPFAAIGRKPLEEK